MENKIDKSIISISNLSKEFNKVKALDKINFEVKSGEVVGIIGPSGSGKSTLLRIIASLEQADSGNIKLFDQDIMVDDKYLKLKNKKEIYDKIGFIFQDFNLFDNLNVYDNIKLALKIRKVKNIDNKINSLLEMFNLESKIKAYPQTLSGGEKQRIAIARALALDPKIILFDEPTSALDVESIDNLVYNIRVLQKQGITMIIVTHDLNFAKSVATNLVFMENARLTENNEQINNNKRVNDFLNKGSYEEKSRY